MKQMTIFYDGLCRVCSAEMDHYKTMRGADQIRFADITSADFDANAEKLDPFKIHREIHAKDAAGRVYVGVEAFILIWSHLPALHWLSRAAKKKPINFVLQIAYKLFVKVRPYLPRKSCEQSPYCEIVKK